MTYLVPLWMMLASVGGGLVLLRGAGVLGELGRIERLALAFVLGLGVTGWLAFFPGVAGVYGQAAFAVILALLCGGLVLLRSPARDAGAVTPLSGIEWLLAAGIGLVLLMDLGEGLSPMADADTLAYHFETPRRYLEHGGIYAIQRAIDGATQLLLQMTYGVAMTLGGKAAAPLWTMISGWGLGAAFYVLARRHISRCWALAATLCLLSTPAIVYGAGTGQVEARLAAFALVAAYAAALSATAGARTRQLGWAVVAGLAAGFFAGSKMTGLIFAFAVCLSLAGGGESLRRMAAFSAAVALAGFQWYVFNWTQTGDPVFPMLWRYVDLAPGFPWDARIDASLQQVWAGEVPIGRTIGWYLAYPFRTVFAPLPAFESLLTGVGPVTIIALPFAILGWIHRKSEVASPLFRLAAVALIFYSIWFFFGPSLRVRHLLPVYPLVLICVFVAAHRFLRTRQAMRGIFAAGLAALLTVQLGGQAIFSKKFLTHLASGENQADFLRRSVSGYDGIAWLNQHLSEDDRVLVVSREWLYLLDIPYFLAHPNIQNLVSIYPGAGDLDRFLSQLSRQKITHIAVPAHFLEAGGSGALERFLRALSPAPCIRNIADVESRAIRSRTLSGSGRKGVSILIFRISPEQCRTS